MFNPVVAFSVVWLFSVLPTYLISQGVFKAPGEEVIFYLFCFFVLFYFGCLVIFLTNKKKSGSRNLAAKVNLNQGALLFVARKLFWIWLLLFIVNIMLSDGVPLYWVLTNDGRTYFDFGVPTFSGFSYAIRNTSFSIFAMLAVLSGLRAKYIVYMLVFLCSVFVVELNRGGGVLMVCMGSAYLVFLSRKLQFVFLFVGVPLFVISFALLQVLRYGASMDYLAEYALNQGIRTNDAVFLMALPVLSYISTPFVNFSIYFEHFDYFKFGAYYSFAGLLPTIVRDFFYFSEDYGLLINEANNVSNFFVPLMRDFGIIGGGVFGLFFSLITVFSYAKMKRGLIFFGLIYPPFFASMVLSVFTLYFTSLVVIFQIILGLAVYFWILGKGA